MTGYTERKQQKLADMAIISLVKLVAQIAKSPLLAEYKNNPRLAKRLPNYRVRLGLGLHSGWAIEGAIGSEFKIDASYLSPNVGVAAKVETATKHYGVTILLTDAVQRRLSDPIAGECRHIDNVEINSKGPFKLFSMDVDDLAIDVSRASLLPTNTKERFRNRIETRRKKAERWSDDYVMADVFERDNDILRLRGKFVDEFFFRFRRAFLNYEAGEWLVARTALEETRFFLTMEDGPSSALIRYLGQHDWQAPKGWVGCRRLPER